MDSEFPSQTAKVESFQVLKLLILISSNKIIEREREIKPKTEI
jgi:hypothetical protein